MFNLLLFETKSLVTNNNKKLRKSKLTRGNTSQAQTLNSNVTQYKDLQFKNKENSTLLEFCWTLKFEKQVFKGEPDKFMNHLLSTFFGSKIQFL